MARLIESSSAQLRLDEARAFVRLHAPHGDLSRAQPRDLWIVGASRGAADDLARAIAVEAGATIGLHRFGLTQLALHLAGPILAGQGFAPVAALGSEAVAARAAFDAQQDGALQYFEPVARTPGFPRALARTLQELRLAEVGADRLAALPLGGADLAGLLGVSTRSSPARAPPTARCCSTPPRGPCGVQLPVPSFRLCCCSMCRSSPTSNSHSSRRSSRGTVSGR